MRNYIFNVELAAMGDTPEDAWEEAVANFIMEPGGAPEDFRTEDEEEE